MNAVNYWSIFAVCMVLGLVWAWAIHEGGARGLQRLATLMRGIFWGLTLYVVTGSALTVAVFIWKGI